MTVDAEDPALFSKLIQQLDHGLTIPNSSTRGKNQNITERRETGVQRPETPSSSLIAQVSEGLLDPLDCLTRPLFILHQGEANVFVPEAPEADAGGDGDLGLLQEDL